MIAQISGAVLATIGVGVGAAIIGVYIVVAKHTGNSSKHPKIGDIVTNQSCTDRTRAIREAITASDRLSASHGKRIEERVKAQGELAASHGKRIEEKVDAQVLVITQLHNSVTALTTLLAGRTCQKEKT